MYEHKLINAIEVIVMLLCDLEEDDSNKLL